MTDVREMIVRKAMRKVIREGAILAHAPLYPDQIQAIVEHAAPRLLEALQRADRREYLERQTNAAERLSPREYETLQHLVWGHTTYVTARHMGVGEVTVKEHRRRLYQRLQVTGGATDAVVQAHVRGHIDICEVEAKRPDKRSSHEA